MEERSREYWQERFRQLEEAQNDTSVRTMQEIEIQFRRAEQALDKKINAWYQRFSVNNELSMTEARRLLNSDDLKEFRWDVEDYIKYGKENAIDERWMKQLENASAKVHISRLEALKVQTQQEMEKLFGNYSDTVDKHIADIYTSAYYHTAFEVQHGIGVGWDMQKLNEEKVSDIIHKPWAADGRNFSERIWTSKTQLINNLHNSLTRMCITGEAPDRAIRELSKSMGVSRSQAANIIQTESAAFSAKAQENCYSELDVEEFEVVETLDSHTCSTCGDMDGKHFPMKDYVIGVTVPPFHPRCRGCTCPYFDDEFTVNDKRVARGKDGKNYYVPANMTYKEWKNSFVDGDTNDFDSTEIYPYERHRSGQRSVRKSKAPETAQNVQSANTLDEVNTLSSKKLGMDVKFSDCTLDYAKEQVECYEKLASEYTQKTNVTQIGTSGMFGKDAVAETFFSADYKYATITVSGKNTKQSALDKLHSYNVVVDEKNANISDLVHEFAHTISSSKGGDEEFWKEIKSVKNRYNRALTKIDKENIVEKAISYQEAIERKTKIYISEYANKSVDEFMAEAFSEAKLSSNPSPYSKEVLEIVDRYFKKDTLENIGEGVTMNLQADINKMITPYEKQVLDAIPKKDGFFDFAAHGSATSIEYGSRDKVLSAREVARIIKHSDAYNGEKVRLLSCSTGSLDDGFAQQLANALGVEVEAPSDVLIVAPNGSFKIGYDGSGKMKTFKPNGRK